jgi:phosphonate transport system substrate-binding protein
MLRDAGLSDGDFTCFLYGHHERAARAVLLGEVDACGVRDVVGERFAERGLRILAWSDPIPNFPLVMPPASDPELRHMIERALIEDPRKDPAALSFIASLDPELADGFAGCRDAEYDGLRKLATRILGPNAMTIGEQALITREGCIER